MFALLVCGHAGPVIGLWSFRSFSRPWGTGRSWTMELGKRVIDSV